VKAYVCTYLHRRPNFREWRLTETLAHTDPLLSRFLHGYRENFWDWGDDPSFFAAEHRLGDVRRASWGVCRADVRKALSEGDLVVFFCARDVGSVWRYHFIGFGTVKALISRKELWTNPAYADYRSFYNVLARLENGQLVQNETFHKYHLDWQHRAKAPYVIFDETASHFNFQDPHCVATWEKGAGLPEPWAADTRSRTLEQLLFIERGITRRLRTSPTLRAHTKLNLALDRRRVRPGRNLPNLVQALARLTSG